MGPFQLAIIWYENRHTVNCALGHTKQRKSQFSCFVLEIPVRNLLSCTAFFLPCDHQLQKAH